MNKITPDVVASDLPNPYGGITRVVASGVYGARFKSGEILFTIPPIQHDQMLAYAEAKTVDAVVIMADGRELLRNVHRNGNALRFSTLVNVEDGLTACAELVRAAEEAVNVDEIAGMYPITYIMLVHA